MRNAVSLVAALLLTPMITSTGFTQITFSVNPNIGFYLPHGATLLDIPSQLSHIESKTPVGGPVITTRLAAWLTPHLGFEGSVGISPAFIAVKTHDGVVDDVRQLLVLTSIRNVYRFPADEIKRLGFQVGTGIGLVSRGGDAWADTPTDPAFAFVVSAGVRAQLSPRKPIAFRMEFEDYISWAQFKMDSGAYTRGRAYHDLVWSLGVVMPLTTRR